MHPRREWRQLLIGSGRVNTRNTRGFAGPLRNGPTYIHIYLSYMCVSESLHSCHHAATLALHHLGHELAEAATTWHEAP